MNEREVRKGILPLPDGRWITEEGDIVLANSVDEKLRQMVEHTRANEVSDWVSRNIKTLRDQSNEQFIVWLRKAAIHGSTLPYEAPLDTSPAQLLTELSTRVQQCSDGQLAQRLSYCICEAIGSWQPAFGLQSLAELSKFAYFSDIQDAVRRLKGRLERVFEIGCPKNKDDVLMLDSVVSALAGFARESDLASSLCQDLLVKPGFEPFAGVLFPAAVAGSRFRKDWPVHAIFMWKAFQKGSTGFFLPDEYFGFHAIDHTGKKVSDTKGVFDLYGAMEELCSILDLSCIGDNLSRLYDLGGEDLVFVLLAGPDPILDYSWRSSESTLKIWPAIRLVRRQPDLVGLEAEVQVGNQQSKFWHLLHRIMEAKVRAQEKLIQLPATSELDTAA